MSDYATMGLGAGLFVALSFGFSWLFAFLYGYSRPLDQEIQTRRVEEFRVAGFGFGLIVATALIWWLTRLT